MRKKLLILMSSLNAGGGERHTIQLMNNIDTGKFHTTLRYFDRREALLGEIDRSRYDSVECLDRHGRFDLALLKAVKDLMKRSTPDAALSISPYPHLYGYLARRLSGSRCKLVTILHQTLQRPGKWENLKTQLFKRVLNKSDLIVFVCKNQLDYWVNRHHIDRAKCVYIYNGIDIDRFDRDEEAPEAVAASRQIGIGGDDIVLGNVAGFRSEKRQEDIIEAAVALRNMGYPVHVVLVGDGPRRPLVERLIRTRGLKGHVSLTGLQRDVRPFLRMMDCFIISSHQETFSLAGLEAMAAGKPVLMTDVGGAREMLEDGVNGYLYAPGAVDELVGRVKDLIDHRSFEEMGRASRQIVAQRFTMQKMVQEYEAIFSEL